jgi:type II secretory pathway pseudopilin PulG
MTFLETVAAVGLLSLVALSVLTVIANINGNNRRQLHELACAELANRLLMQYVDDSESMPSQFAPVEYGPSRYRWSLTFEPITVELAEPESDRFVATGANTSDRLSTFKVLRLTVWLAEESGGANALGPGVPSASVARLHDPNVLATWTRDKFRRMYDKYGMRGILDMTQGRTPGSGGSGPTRGAGGGSGGGAGGSGAGGGNGGGNNNGGGS